MTTTMGFLFFRSSKDDIDERIASKKKQIESLQKKIDSANKSIADAKAYNKAVGKKIITFEGLEYTMKRNKEILARLKEDLAKLREKKKR